MRRILLLAALSMVVPQPDVSNPDDRALIAVEHPAQRTAARLLDAGVTVIRDQGGYLVALAAADDLALIDRLGLAYRVLDEHPSGKTYYIVPPASLEPKASREAAVSGATHRLVMASPEGSIIEATPEAADLLSASGAHIAKLYMTPMRAAEVDKNPPRAPPTAADPLIQAMADSVSGTTIDTTIQRMQDFVNRYALGDSVFSARDWIVARFRSFGIDSVTLQEFDTRMAQNVVAVIPGVGHPKKQILIGGHYDSTAIGFVVAPGADDNASGTTCVLECARILSQYRYDYTLVFIAFCGEEQGLVGSEYYAAQAAANGDDIVAMVNVDMIGFLYPYNDPLDLDLVSNASSVWLRDLLFAVRALYVPQLAVVNGALPNGASSDHASFWRHGFDAVMFWEDTNHWSTYIHTVNDLVGLSYNSPTLAHNSTRLAVATIATLAEPYRVIIQHVSNIDAVNTQSAYRIDANVLTDHELDADSLLVRYTVREPEAPGAVRSVGATSGVVAEQEESVPLVYLGHDNAYEAVIPPQAAGAVVDYYVAAATTDGFHAVDPKGAPALRHRFVVGEPVVVFVDDFEEDNGWTSGAPDDDATDGFWVREAPHETRIDIKVVQPGYDHSPDPGSVCFVTANAPDGVITQGYKDVDNGHTTLLSPVFDLSGYSNVWFSYYRWYTNDSGGLVPDDVWVVDVSEDGGATWVNVETLAESERAWNRVEGNLVDYVQPTAAVRFRFIAADDYDTSVVEALVDDFALVSYTGDATVAGTPPPQTLLAQNYPNPFNPQTTIRVHVTPPARATLRVFDVAGRHVATLLDHDLISGDRLIPWDGTSHTGTHVASGVYFYRLETPSTTLTRKMVVVR